MKKLILLFGLVALLLANDASKYMNKGRVAYQHGKFLDAQKYMMKACDLGNGGACAVVAFLYDGGKGKITKDSSKALIYGKKACKLNFGDSCFNVGLAYDKGNVVKKNSAKAFQYYLKACKLNVGEGCYNVGVTYLTGSNGSQSYTKAKEYDLKACKLNDKLACKAYSYLKNHGY